MPRQKSFYIEGQLVTVKRHPQSRNLRLRMDPLHKTPVLTAPSHCASGAIEHFLISSQDWWRHQISKTQNTTGLATIPILGQTYQIIHKPALKRVEFNHETREIMLSKATGDPKSVIYPHLVKLATPLFEEYSREYAQRLNVHYIDLRLRDYRARWGACKHDKRLVYSWRLIMAPLDVLRYVCAHEVAHLRHFNHSPDFWATVAALMPDYKIHKNWLKQNGNSLFTAF